MMAPAGERYSGAGFAWSSGLAQERAQPGCPAPGSVTVERSSRTLRQARLARSAWRCLSTKPSKHPSSVDKNPERQPTRAVATVDVDPASGRARLSYRRAAHLFGARTGATLHQLRHSALTHAAEEGTNLPMLLARSRHASVRSLERYARPGPEAGARTMAESDPARRRRGCSRLGAMAVDEPPTTCDGGPGDDRSPRQAQVSFGSGYACQIRCFRERRATTQDNTKLTTPSTATTAQKTLGTPLGA